MLARALPIVEIAGAIRPANARQRDRDQMEAPKHQIDFSVDEEIIITYSSILTVRQVLELAKLDPSNHYLILVRGNTQEPLKDLDAEVHLHEKEKFISVYTGGTPLS